MTNRQGLLGSVAISAALSASRITGANLLEEDHHHSQSAERSATPSHVAHAAKSVDRKCVTTSPSNKV